MTGENASVTVELSWLGSGRVSKARPGKEEELAGRADTIVVGRIRP